MTVKQVIQRVDELQKLLSHEDYYCILLVLKKRPMRFSQIQKLLSINSARLDEVLEFLHKGFWIVPRTIPTKNRILAQYELTRRGTKLLELIS